MRYQVDAVLGIGPLLLLLIQRCGSRRLCCSRRAFPRKSACAPDHERGYAGRSAPPRPPGRRMPCAAQAPVAQTTAGATATRTGGYARRAGGSTQLRSLAHLEHEQHAARSHAPLRSAGAPAGRGGGRDDPCTRGQCLDSRRAASRRWSMRESRSVAGRVPGRLAEGVVLDEDDVERVGEPAAEPGRDGVESVLAGRRPRSESRRRTAGSLESVTPAGCGRRGCQRPPGV